MRAFEQRLDQHDAWWSNELAQAVEQVEAEEQEAAARAISHGPVESDVEEDGRGGESSGLSTVSSSRFEGLDEIGRRRIATARWWQWGYGHEAMLGVLGIASFLWVIYQ
jgi:hypothetical protein